MGGHRRGLEVGVNASAGGVVLEGGGRGGLAQRTDGVAAMGSGGSYALGAARAVFQNSSRDGGQSVEAAMGIAGDLCIYTNRNIEVETIE